ncbi:MAG: flagellar FlbD family protein [Cellulosilyticaceae bacterium]
MIHVTKLNKQAFVLNAELIEVIEATPDTVITMTTGKKFVVSETSEEVIQSIIAYKRQIMIPVER